MPMFTPERAILNLRRTPVILNGVLIGVDQALAQTATDGADGWSVLEVVCHLNDFEAIFLERIRMMIESDNPQFPAYDQVALADERRYADQDFVAVLTNLMSRRRSTIDYVSALDAEQWARPGIHAAHGAVTVMDTVVNMPLHDVIHIEQILKALGKATPFSEL